MSEKCCGTCRHYKGNTHPGNCMHPLTQRARKKPRPRAVTVYGVYPGDGQDCPCHEPKGNDERPAK